MTKIGRDLIDRSLGSRHSFEATAPSYGQCERKPNDRDDVCEMNRLRAENERLRAALRRITDEADSDNGLTAWDGSAIARAALEGGKDG